MGTVYVSKHASASNLKDGSDATTNAWATAIYGFTTMLGSDTLKFGTGTYDIDRPSTACPIPSGSAGNPTIITDNGDGVVTFQHPGTANRYGLINFSSGAAVSYISFIGTTQGSLVFDGENQVNCGALFYFAQGITQNNHHLTVRRCELKNAKESPLIGGHSDSTTVDQCIIHDSGSTSINTIVQDHAVYASGPNLVITNNLIYNIWGLAIKCHSTSAHNYSGRNFSGNIIYNCGFGDGDEKGQGILMAEGSGSIENNLVYKTSGTGIEVWRGRDVTIYHNTLHDNARYGIQVGFSSPNALRCLVKNNIVTGSALGDMRVTTATDTTVAWNCFESAAIINSGVNTIESNNLFSQSIAAIWVDPTNATLASRNYRLKAGSPAIGVASTNEVQAVGVTTDLVGTVRPQGAFVDMGAYELTTGTGSAFIWEAVVQNAGSWFGSGNTDNSVRCLVKGSVTTAGASVIRVFFRGRSDATYTITKVSIVERDGSTLDGVDGTNTQITFGGNAWGDATTVTQNGEVFSDNTTFALDGDKDYFVTYYASGTIGPGILGGSTDGVWRVAGDSAATIDWSGLTLVGTHLGTYGLFYIEEVDDPGPPADAPILGHASPYLAVDGVYLSVPLVLTDGDNDAETVAMVGTDLVIRTTPTANVTVTSP